VPWELHRSLAEWNILQGHILPLLASHAKDDPEVKKERERLGKGESDPFSVW
jgi:hypothetical protein